MKTSSLILVTACLLSSACSSSRFGEVVYVPSVDVGVERETARPRARMRVVEVRGVDEVHAAGGWEDYDGDGFPTAPSADRGWTPAPVARSDDVVERRELAPARDEIPVEQTRSAPAGGMAEAKDPPADLSARRDTRTYSSRVIPRRNDIPASVERPPVPAVAGAKVRSAWADKAIREDNRAEFDAMVLASAKLGKASFEDEAGRVYFGRSNSVEDGCYNVSILVTTRGELPVVARGTAQVCG